MRLSLVKRLKGCREVELSCNCALHCSIDSDKVARLFQISFGEGKNSFRYNFQMDREGAKYVVATLQGFLTRHG